MLERAKNLTENYGIPAAQKIIEKCKAFADPECKNYVVSTTLSLTSLLYYLSACDTVTKHLAGLISVGSMVAAIQQSGGVEKVYGNAMSFFQSVKADPSITVSHAVDAGLRSRSPKM